METSTYGTGSVACCQIQIKIPTLNVDVVLDSDRRALEAPMHQLLSQSDSCEASSLATALEAA